MSIIYLVVLMVMEVGQEDFIRSQMMAVYTIMIFQGWDWRICFQAINAHVITKGVSKTAKLFKRRECNNC